VQEQVDAELVKLGEECDKVLETAPEPVHRPHYDHIKLATWWRRGRAHRTRAVATKSDSHQAVDTACAPFCSDADSRSTVSAASIVSRWLTICLQWLLFQPMHYHCSESRVMPLRGIELF